MIRISDTLTLIFSDEKARIFGKGFLVGATVICGVYAPMLLYKIIVFIVCFCFYGAIAAAVFPVFLNGYLKKYLDKRHHDILFIAFFILAVAIAISISLLMVGEIGKNPVSPEFDIEQSYPY